MNASCNMPSGSDLWSTNDELKLLSKVTEKIKGHTFNLGVFAGQGLQLREQCVRTLVSFYKTFVHLKHRRVSSAFRSLGVIPGQRSIKYVGRKLNDGDISGAWLAMQYGWLPTISDIHESAKAYEELTGPSRTETLYISKKGPVVEYDGSCSTSLYKCPGSAQVSNKIWYTLEENLSMPRSLGLTDPASVAWELLPFSFVADWFIPIGSYLENLNTIPALKGKWIRTTREGAGASGFYCMPNSCRCATDHYVRVSYSRTAGSSLTVPLPSFTQGLRGARIYNAVALIHQLARGKSSAFMLTD